MQSNSVAEIVVGAQDPTGAEIRTVFTKVVPKYAVYLTPERVMVQFADDDTLGSEQRKTLSPLNAIRGEINGLIDGWRSSSRAEDRARARMLDRRAADALILGLQGDPVRAAALLEAVKADAIEERMSSARARYLLVAFLVFAAIPVAYVLIDLAGALFPNSNASRLRGKELWWPVFLGGLGALFSIAIFIRSRELSTDLQSRDNTIDAILRVFIGCMSAVLLVALIRGNLISFGFGSSPIKMDWTESPAFDAAMVVAFAAGFSEKMVGDYLSTAFLRGSEGAAGSETITAAVSSLPRPATHEDDPRGMAILSRPRPAASDAVEANEVQLHEDEDYVDGCVCNVHLAEDDLTSDEELPPSDGGVERAA